MTAIWGPLGWMTLHSVSSIYPEEPTDTEKRLMTTWLDMFRDTITCHYCRTHFTELLAKYRSKFPNMMNSRREFMAFAFRAHNAVNRRLHKPIYNTLEECMALLRKNVETRPAVQYRTAYLTHIRRDWGRLRDTAGFVGLKKIVEMMKIENEYIKPRDTNFDVVIEDIEVVVPYGILEKIEDSILFHRSREARRAPPVSSPSLSTPVPVVKPIRGGFQVTSKGIRLR